MVNGVVVENGDRRTRLRIKTDGANILRLRDAMSAEEATTPIKQAYFVAQRAVAGEITTADALEILFAAIEELKKSELDGALLSEAETHLRASNLYPAMRTLGRLIAGSAEEAGDKRG